MVARVARASKRALLLAQPIALAALAFMVEGGRWKPWAPEIAPPSGERPTAARIASRRVPGFAGRPHRRHAGAGAGGSGSNGRSRW